MKMDLDTEDRVDRVKRALEGFNDLLGSMDPTLSLNFGPNGILALTTLISEELERVLPEGGGRPKRPSNDMED